MKDNKASCCSVKIEDWEDEITPLPAKEQLKSKWDDEDIDDSDIKELWEDEDELAPPPI
ncbi:hypothetical protein V6Z12_A09G061700 [Gossypium hirsutum]